MVMSAETTRVGFVLNGAPVSVRADHPHLLAALREELDVTSLKDGCSPSGQCGCCTVHVDGKAVVSCNLPLDKVAGKAVVTLEGLEPTERNRFAGAFAACGGLQCGFCIPGIVMRAKAQIDKKGSALTREAMKPHLGAHLCRCTGYVKILDAIEAVAVGKQLQPQLSTTVGGVGAKYQAPELTLGDRDYIDDIRVPGMLHAAIVKSPVPRGTIRGIDTSAARALPGVVAVITAADLLRAPIGCSETRYGVVVRDRPILASDRVTFVGEPVAAVVAGTRAQARTAAAAVLVDVDEQPPAWDLATALAPDAPILSSSAISPASSTSVAAARLSSRFVRRFVPGIGTRCGSRCSSHASAICAADTPRAAPSSRTRAASRRLMSKCSPCRRGSPHDR